MKKSKKLLSLACATVMLAAVAVPAGAETMVNQQVASTVLTKESVNAQELQARNYRRYGYKSLVQVKSNRKEKSLVTGSKSGPSSRIAEHVVEELTGEDYLSFYIKVSGKQRSEEVYQGVEELEMEYKYKINETYTGDATLYAVNTGSKTARVKGKIQFN